MKRPHCEKCGGNHWRFVGCEQADVVNAREDKNAAAEQRKHTFHRNTFARGLADQTRRGWGHGWGRK